MRDAYERSGTPIDELTDEEVIAEAQSQLDFALAVGDDLTEIEVELLQRLISIAVPTYYTEGSIK